MVAYDSLLIDYIFDKLYSVDVNSGHISNARSFADSWAGSLESCFDPLCI